LIKRPMIWILLSYLFGLYNAWTSKPFVFIFLFIILFYLMIYTFTFHLDNKIIIKQDGFLWIIPVFILLGFLLMGNSMSIDPVDVHIDNKEKCTVTGDIQMIVDKEWGMSIYLKNVSIILDDINNVFYCKSILVNTFEKENYRVKNSINIKGNISKTSKASNPGQFDPNLYYKSKKINYIVSAKKIDIINNKYSKIHSGLNIFKNYLSNTYNEILEPREAGILLAMLLGDKSLLDDEIQTLYQENGISHILAISGLHISLIALSLYKIFKKIKIPQSISIVITIFTLYLYALLTNFSISTSRALIMVSTLLLAKIFGKTYDILSSASFAGTLILINNPMEIFQAGFLLSFGAIYGIGLLFPAIDNLYKSKNKILQAIAINVSIQIMTLPVVLAFFFEIPTYSMFINLIIIPLMSLLVLFSLFAGVLGGIYAPIGVFVIGLSNYILKVFEILSKGASNLPNNIIVLGSKSAYKIIAYYMVILTFIYISNKYKKRVLLFLLPLAIIVLVYQPQNNLMEVTMLDVGQGDGIFIKSESDTIYFIDGGSSDVKNLGKNRISPFLKSKGIKEIDYAIISHLDYDHISGILEIISNPNRNSGIIIRNLILPQTSLVDKAYIEMVELAKSNGIEIGYIKSGDTIIDGDLRITCLHPSIGFNPGSRNSYSTVLKVIYKKFSLLLTGDLERDGEMIITENIIKEKPRKYTVLKVAHHGSKHSTYEDFLYVINPKISLISSSRFNSYGHPHEELLERLEKIGSKYKITYKSGAITILTNGIEVEVSEFNEIENIK